MIMLPLPRLRKAFSLAIGVFLVILSFSSSLFSTSDSLDGCDLELTTTVRGYYLGDERIQWSGVEESFGAEAVIMPEVRKMAGGGEFFATGEFYLNQVYGDNILIDDLREHWTANFEVDTFELSQLYVGFRGRSFEIKAGKVASPFGRQVLKPWSNSRVDAPFIRTEVILWRETGLFFTYRRGVMVVDIALINGESERDTNSDKGGIIRVGLEGDNWSVGISKKQHDGFGSERQKEYSNHEGIDLMFSRGPWTISAEYLQDEYGFHRDFELDEIFWKRSLYYRDIFKAYKEPVTGHGGYLDIGYGGRVWEVHLNYGEYYPEEIGNPFHDDPIRRLLLKATARVDKNVRFYGMALFENERERESWKHNARGYALLLGMEFSLTFSNR